MRHYTALIAGFLSIGWAFTLHAKTIGIAKALIDGRSSVSRVDAENAASVMA